MRTIRNMFGTCLIIALGVGFAYIWYSVYGKTGQMPFAEYGYVEDATVLSKHIDSGKKSGDSSYMVTTDKGTFEVQNGYWLDVWNADAIYGQLIEGHHYNFSVRGEEVVMYNINEYRYIVRVSESTKKN